MQRIQLSPQQDEVLLKIMQWYRGNEPILVLGGYAGTGKTTLSDIIAGEIGRSKVHHCAYTGKAANVLRERGAANATTIHGAIYIPDGDEEGNPTTDNSDGFFDGMETRGSDRVAGGNPKFRLNYESDIIDANLVIIDEYSMLSKEIIDDLLLLNNKLLFLGDPFQLPPVSGKCFLEPDLFLTEVHRQALDSPIIRAATTVRNGGKLEYCDEGEFVYNRRQHFEPRIFMEADQVIVGMNKTRHAWNKRFRERKGRFDIYPVYGDKMICLQNDKQHGLFNGMIGECTRAAKWIDEGKIDLQFTCDNKYNLECWDGPFNGEETTTEKRFRWLPRFGYAYAITCHKSQGSEFDNVVLYREQIGQDKIDRAKWLYTGITRAKKKLTLIDPK